MAKKKKKLSRSDSSELLFPSNKVGKVKLSRIIRSEHKSKINDINEIVNRATQIVTHTYNFLKLFCIDHYLCYRTLPDINKTFIMLIMKTVSESSSKRGKFNANTYQMKYQLEEFYELEYKHLV